MTDIQTIFPRQAVPALTVPLVGGGRFDLSAERPEHFTMVVFYRGLHCPICKAQLRDIQAKLADFAAAGVGIVAISSDSAERAAQAASEWGIGDLRLGYGLPFAVAREWGLFVSEGRPNTAEPALFSEPGIFLIRADGTLYFSSIQTMPFARPAAADLLFAAKYVIEKSYPARGELTTLPRQAA